MDIKRTAGEIVRSRKKVRGQGEKGGWKRNPKKQRSPDDCLIQGEKYILNSVVRGNSTRDTALKV